MMNITALSGALTNIQATNDISTAVLAKAMDSNEALGQGVVKMIDSAAMERSVNPSVGSNFDVRA